MVRRDYPNKDTTKSSEKAEFIDPNARHPTKEEAGQGTATKATRRPKPSLSPRKSTASEDPNDYFERAQHLYGRHDARRIVANAPMGAPSPFPAGGGDREAGN